MVNLEDAKLVSSLFPSLMPIFCLESVTHFFHLLNSWVNVLSSTRLKLLLKDFNMLIFWWQVKCLSNRSRLRKHLFSKMLFKIPIFVKANFVDIINSDVLNSYGLIENLLFNIIEDFVSWNLCVSFSSGSWTMTFYKGFSSKFFFNSLLLSESFKMRVFALRQKLELPVSEHVVELLLRLDTFVVFDIILINLSVLASLWLYRSKIIIIYLEPGVSLSETHRVNQREFLIIGTFDASLLFLVNPHVI